MTAMYTLKKGGAYDRFIMMVEAFLERECEVHCVSLTPIQIEHSHFHNHVAFFVSKEADGLIARLLVLILFPFWCTWIAWRNKIDLVIAFGSLYAFIEGLSKWFLKKPMVTFIRGNSSFGLRMRNSSKYAVYLNRVIENIGLHVSDRIIANNTALGEEILKGLGGKDIEVRVLFNDIRPMNIYGPEDISETRAKYGILRDAKVLVTAGIINRGKNIEILIKCLPRIGIENLFLLVVGEGSAEAELHYRKSLEKLAMDLRLDGRVVFTGWLEKKELWKIFRATDLFVLPSKSEGMPNAMLEALGCDLPCLGSNIPGIKDILQYDDLMFDPADEEAVAKKIRDIFSSVLCFEKLNTLCLERKKVFLFDWKEALFQIVTSGIYHKGESLG